MKTTNFYDIATEATYEKVASVLGVNKLVAPIKSLYSTGVGKLKGAYKSVESSNPIATKGVLGMSGLLTGAYLGDKSYQSMKRMSEQVKELENSVPVNNEFINVQGVN